MSLTLREAWTGFAKDPVQGLLKLGWPVYDASSEFLLLEVLVQMLILVVIEASVVVLGGKDSAKVTFEEPAKVDQEQCGRVG